MVTLQTDGDQKVLFLGNFVGRENPTNTGTIYPDGLFHENVKSLVYGVLEMQGTETRRSCKDYEIEVLLHELLVGVKTGKHLVLGHIHFLFVGSGNSLVGTLYLVDVGIGHGHELRIVRGV